MSQYEDLLVDALLDDGFTLEEAMRLIRLQERVQRQRHDEEVAQRILSHWLGERENRINLN